MKSFEGKRMQIKQWGINEFDIPAIVELAEVVGHQVLLKVVFIFS